MREYLSADSIAATVRMLRATFSGSFLLVEGSIDARLLKRLVDHAVCHVQVCYNRINVIRVVTLLDAGEFAGHLGVIDRDFGELFGERFVSENLVLTDLNDVEMTIFQSDVFERFVGEYASPDKILALENANNMPIRDVLINSASTIGIVRYLSRLRDWNLAFEKMTVRYQGRHEIAIDIAQQIEHLRGRSQGTSMPSLDAVVREIAEACVRFPDRLLYTCGHDVCEIVAKAIHDVFGRAHIALHRSGKAVEEVFRAAFSRENFAATQMFADMRAWEQDHPPFRVFPR